MSDQTPYRRIPKQSRSQQRVDHILDTAERMFIEQGYESATTNAIAARAGVSIGSLYQFFPSKEAILNTLVGRYQTDLKALFEDPALDALPLIESMRHLVERMVAYDQTHAGFKVMVAASGVALAMREQVVAAVDDLMRRRIPALEPARRRQMAFTLIVIVRGIMMLSGPPTFFSSQQVQADVQHALIGYIRASLDAEGITL
ncbi:MAG: TetR/AcrR family transcriptional regulator [Anaerolineae bacterium]